MGERSHQSFAEIRLEWNFGFNRSNCWLWFDGAKDIRSLIVIYEQNLSSFESEDGESTT